MSEKQIVKYEKNNNEKNLIISNETKNNETKNKVSKSKRHAVSNSLSENINVHKISDIEQYRKLNPTHTVLLWEKVNYDRHGNVINTEKIATNFESIAQFIVGKTMT